MKTTAHVHIRHEGWQKFTRTSDMQWCNGAMEGWRHLIHYYSSQYIHHGKWKKAHNHIHTICKRIYRKGYGRCTWWLGDRPISRHCSGSNEEMTCPLTGNNSPSIPHPLRECFPGFIFTTFTCISMEVSFEWCTKILES